MKRRFSPQEKAALFLTSDGKSAISGKDLGDNWHADHIVPWSKGGLTDVINGQPLLPGENLKKGATLLNKRKWQDEFLREYIKSPHKTFLLAALPGAGKTIAALRAVNEFLRPSGVVARNRRTIIVVPTFHLKTQWREKASELFQIELKVEEFTGSLNDDFQGVVVTYAAIARNPLLFRRLCSMYECTVILDEIHHARDNLSWGDGLRSAFEQAFRQLGLTGTPFRTDRGKIPFLRTQLGPDGEEYVCDYKYDYPTALRDEVVRYVSFHRMGGSVTVGRGRDITIFDTDDEDLDDDEASARLRNLIGAYSFTYDVLSQAHAKLLSIRDLKPDAGGLVLCMNQKHAEFIAGILKEITGIAPDVVVSDEKYNNGDIQSFSKSKRLWIVAVRMVSEGIDIQRLMVLAYLTNTATELFFRQAVGRIVRRQGEEFDTEAYCFMPDDPRLQGFARRIEMFQFQAGTEYEDDDNDQEYDGSEDLLDIPKSELEQILDSSGAQLKGIINAGHQYGSGEASEIIEMSKEYGIPETTMGKIWMRLKQSAPAAPLQSSATAVQPVEVLQKDLKSKCAKLASRLAIQSGVEHKEIHKSYIALTGIRQGIMSVSQLEAKLQWLQKRLKEMKSFSGTTDL